MTYIPNTDEDRKKMLQELELSSIDELFKNIPEGLRCKGLDIPEGKSELELRKYFSILAKKNSTGLACFLADVCHETTVYRREPFYFCHHIA